MEYIYTSRHGRMGTLRLRGAEGLIFFFYIICFLFPITHINYKDVDNDEDI